MADVVRVMLQMKQTQFLAAASFGPVEAAPSIGIGKVEGVQVDHAFAPVPLPSGPIPALSGSNEFAAWSEQTPTYIMRATVAAEALDRFRDAVQSDKQIVGAFSDPVIQPITTCPNGPIGTDVDVANALAVGQLASMGLDGAGVRVVVVDTGLNIPYLYARGKHPTFDSQLSWGPQPGMPLGNIAVNHGTMCAFDICIAAPNCILVDHAVLASPPHTGPVISGLLSDAVKSYGVLLTWITQGPGTFAGTQQAPPLVVNNSWGMFNPSWDFPVGDPMNYSDNPQHPFNIIAGTLDSAGADLLFAAGNCGAECPDNRCQGAINNGIYGANSSAAVTCVAGVTVQGDRLGYSTRGPGHLVQAKPDIASFAHFAGSGVYPSDGGTSAATPVLTGVIAAVRKLFPPGRVSTAEMRELLRSCAGQSFSYELGYGIIDVSRLLSELQNA